MNLRIWEKSAACILLVGEKWIYLSGMRWANLGLYFIES